MIRRTKRTKGAKQRREPNSSHKHGSRMSARIWHDTSTHIMCSISFSFSELPSQVRVPSAPEVAQWEGGSRGAPGGDHAAPEDGRSGGDRNPQQPDPGENQGRAPVRQLGQEGRHGRDAEEEALRHPARLVQEETHVGVSCNYLIRLVSMEQLYTLDNYHLSLTLTLLLTLP